MFVTIVLAFNLPPIFLGIMDVPSIAAGCSPSVWLLVNALFCLSHIYFSFYVAKTLYYGNNDESNDDPEVPNHRRRYRGGPNQSVYDKATQLFCYDPWMALYLLILIAFFVSINMALTISVDETACAANTTVSVVSAVVCGYSFLFVGASVLCCSVCCAGLFCPNGDPMSSHSRPPTATNTYTRPTPQPPSSRPPPQASAPPVYQDEEEEPPMAYATYAGTASAPPPPSANENYKTPPPSNFDNNNASNMEQGYGSRTGGNANGNQNRGTADRLVNDAIQGVANSINQIWTSVRKGSNNNGNTNNNRR